MGGLLSRSAPTLMVNLPLTTGIEGKVAGGVTFTRASDQWFTPDVNGLGQEILTLAQQNLTGGWGIFGESTYGNGEGRIYSSTGVWSMLTISNTPLIVGRTYQVRYVVTKSSGAIKENASNVVFPSSLGPQTVTWVATATSLGLARASTGIPCDVTITSVSIREVYSSGVMTSVPSGAPACNSKGILLEPASTNKCTCYGVIPADTLGPELITASADRDLSSDTGFWTKTNCTISGGVATVTAGTGMLEKSLLVIGRVYEATFTVSGYSNGSIGISSGTVAGGIYVTANGTYTRRFVNDVAGGVFRLVSTVAGVSFDNISVKEVQFAVGAKTLYSGGAWVQNHTNMSLSGDTAAALTTVDDAATLAAAGLQNICLSGKVYKLDNSAGAAIATASMILSGNNTNPVSFSIQARISGAVQGRIKARSGGTSIYFNNTSYGTVKSLNDVTLEATMPEIKADPGCVIYFTLPQLEELPFSTSPMPCQGATASRAVTVLKFPVLGNMKGNDVTIYMELTPVGMMPAPGYPSVFNVFKDSNTSVSVSIHQTDLKVYAQKKSGGVLSNTQRIGTIAAPGTLMKFVGRWSSSSGITTFCAGAVANTATGSAKDNIDLSGAVVELSASLTDVSRYVRNVQIYRRALPDDQCIRMTT